jgi:hypothetical protein
MTTYTVTIKGATANEAVEILIQHPGAAVTQEAAAVAVPKPVKAKKVKAKAKKGPEETDKAFLARVVRTIPDEGIRGGALAKRLGVAAQGGLGRITRATKRLGLKDIAARDDQGLWVKGKNAIEALKLEAAVA